jgi:hypothetical protein
MINNHPFPFNGKHKQGSALVITLAFLVLISGLVLLFFQQSTLNQRIAFSSVNQFRAETVAHAALDTIVGDLRNEIVAGSTISTISGKSIYISSTNQTVEPCRIGDQGFTNVIAASSGSNPFWTGVGYSTDGPVRSAIGNRTDSPSLNGVYILPNRWNKPGLLGDPGNGKIPTLPNSPSGNTYVPPDWVLVTRQGAITNATNIVATDSLNPPLYDKSSQNTNYVIGRYAYVIYNEGGLLDINVAGCPQSIVGTDPNTKRGLLPQINLTDLLSNASVADSNAVQDATALVSWRNQASGASSSAFTNFVYSSTNGFATVVPGDQAFVSRQDLINYVINNQIPTTVLQFLGTFTRELNAPSYTPPKLGSASRPQTLSGEGYRNTTTTMSYTDDQFNPSLIDTRVVKSFTRYSDSTQAQVGEPLIKYRFPLNRLAWIAYNGHPASITKADGSAVSDADTQAAFGLTWNSSAGNWTYGHPGEGNTGQILTLAQVANLSSPREPDFFELLQAGILVGSLGKQSGGNFSPNLKTLDSNPFYQIIQIGANLIDQADSDSYPTRIVFDANGSVAPYEFDGIESLPYISRVWESCYHHLATSTNPTQPKFGIWYIPEIWNPNITTVSSGPGPTVFKFTVNGTPRATGKAWANINNTLSSQISYPTAVTSDAGLTFGNPSIFATPRLLTPDLLSSSPSDQYDYIDESAQGGSTFCGIFVGEVSGTTSGSPSGMGPVIAAQNPLTFQISYQDSSGNWVPYSRTRYITGGQGDSGHFGTPSTWDHVRLDVLDLRSDPRTDRFGMEGCLGSGFNLQNAPYQIPITTGNNPMRPTAAAGMMAKVNLPNTGLGWFYSSSYPYVLADNHGNTSLYSAPTSSMYYNDPDGVPRRGDGAYNGGESGSTDNGGYPLAYPFLGTNAESRPVILNRPFRSVADMGYAFRDMPWKHLDFFTAESADAALLDIFCINESPKPLAPSTDPVPVAGRVDLNTRQEPVLQAILTGAMQWDDGNQTLSANDAQILAASLVKLTGDSSTGRPLLNRSELVTRWMPNIPALGTSPGGIVKRQREAPIRALAEVGNTRTWNLLIDVIAQSGRYVSTGGTDLNKQFIVEGERRYWLHIALDRYTGAIVAKALEPVYE